MHATEENLGIAFQFKHIEMYFKNSVDTALRPIALEDYMSDQLLRISLTYNLM